MPITVNDQKKLFRLDAGNSTYIMQVRENGYLLHLYYGSHISDSDVSHLLDNHINAAFSPLPPSRESSYFSLDTQPQEYSCNGAGDFRISALSVKMPNGSTSTELKYASYKIIDGKPSLEGLPATYVNCDSEAKTLEITMEDTLSGAEVVLCYTAFESLNAIARNVRIRNTSDALLKVDRAYSMTLDLNRADFDLIHFHGKHVAERKFERSPLIHGIQSIASKRGSSSHNHNPFVILCDKTATETFGEAYGFSFVYSGNFASDIEVDCFDHTRVIMGINPTDFEWLLSPGDFFTTPEVVMVYSDAGLEKLSHTYHRLYRKNLCRGPWRDAKRPILVNNWEATYFEFNSDKLVNIAKDAAELGIEMLVMDDGWFGNRNDDHSSLGDWFVNEDKISGGLDALVKRVNDLGLKFGIWFEPEMISPISKLYEAHPDWCLHVNGRDRSTGRQQLVLDMSRKDVRDYLFNVMSEILSSSNIAYVKWDFNRNLSEVGSELLPPEQQHEVFHRYVLGLYELLERLITAFPNVLFEGCSGGGGRFDPAMLYYSPQIWTSDNTDAIERCYIQYGTSFAYPASSMSAHVSASPNHQTGRATSFKTRGNVAMAGAFGYELDLNKLSVEEKQLVKEQVESYHKYYHIINFGDFYRLISPYDNNYYCAWEYVSEDKNEALLTFVSMRVVINHTYFVRLRGLDPTKIYVDVATGDEYHGDTLMNAGLRLKEWMGDGSSIVKYFKAKE
ncbi:MAG: alpha-galactosidase [Eubacteriales bacterium]|nr:alpha-galactosidase [Eubacteriales bacterium]MDD4475013.1 alpha-galactosidase [Eubacteriales bacterium]